MDALNRCCGFSRPFILAIHCIILALHQRSIAVFDFHIWHDHLACIRIAARHFSLAQGDVFGRNGEVFGTGAGEIIVLLRIHHHLGSARIYVILIQRLLQGSHILLPVCHGIAGLLGLAIVDRLLGKRHLDFLIRQVALQDQEDKSTMAACKIAVFRPRCRHHIQPGVVQNVCLVRRACRHRFLAAGKGGVGIGQSVLTVCQRLASRCIQHGQRTIQRVSISDYIVFCALYV